MPRYGQQKPPLGSQLMLGHPLAQGLVSSLLMNESAGLNTVDDCGGVARLGVDLRWKPTPFGVGISNEAGFSEAISETNGRLDSLVKFTIAFLVKGDPSAQAFQWISEKGIFQSQTSEKWAIFQQGSAGVQIVTYSVGDGTGSNSFNSTKPVLDLTYHSVAMTFDGATIRGFVDGKVDGSTGCTRTPFASTDSMKLGATDRANKPVWVYHRVYNRALSASEIAWLAAEPYAMFSRPSRRTYSVPAATGVFFRRSLTNRAGSRSAA